MYGSSANRSGILRYGSSRQAVQRGLSVRAQCVLLLRSLSGVPSREKHHHYHRHHHRHHFEETIKINTATTTSRLKAFLLWSHWLPVAVFLVACRRYTGCAAWLFCLLVVVSLDARRRFSPCSLLSQWLPVISCQLSGCEVRELLAAVPRKPEKRFVCLTWSSRA